jgi:hypothetical protein
MEKLPSDYLFREQATLLIKMKKYKKAFDVAATNLSFEACEQLAELALQVQKAEDALKSSNSTSKSNKPKRPEG